MIEELRTRDLVILAALLVAGLVGTLVALGSRGADAQFIQEQKHPPGLKASAVARLVQTAPYPATGKGAGTSAVCKARGAGPLRNPWSCVVRYKSGERVRLRVRLNSDGSYRAAYLGRYAGGGAARGCCIDLPGAE